MSALTLSPTPTQKKPKRQILVKAEQFFIGNFDTLVCEFLGSSLFTFLGSASSNVASSGLGPAFGNAISLTSVLYLLSNDEGSGKLNPAASLSFLLAGKSTITKCVWVNILCTLCDSAPAYTPDWRRTRPRPPSRCTPPPGLRMAEVLRV